MHRQGADPARMTAEDFLCDFCGRSWAPDRPMVEGHRGSLFCAPCLTVAYVSLILGGQGVDIPPDAACTLCLTHKDEPHWRSPAKDATACRACILQAARMLEKDRDTNWSRPAP